MDKSLESNSELDDEGMSQVDKDFFIKSIRKPIDFAYRSGKKMLEDACKGVVNLCTSMMKPRRTNVKVRKFNFYKTEEYMFENYKKE